MDRSSRQKINKETGDLNDNKDQVDLTHIHRKFYLTAEENLLLNGHTEHSQDRLC